jgi:hypothetical protein
VDDFIAFIGISREEFFQVIEENRNRKIWKRSSDGNWYIPGHLKD